MLLSAVRVAWRAGPRQRGFSSMVRAPRAGISIESFTLRARAQELIKKLRAASGAPITDCKKAISEVGDDLDAAFEWLRKKGAARASEKSGRATQHVSPKKRSSGGATLTYSHTIFARRASWARSSPRTARTPC